MWLTFLSLDARAGNLTYDLALNVHDGDPSPVDAGLSADDVAPSGPPATLWALLAAVALLGTMVVVAARERRGGGRIAI